MSKLVNISVLFPNNIVIIFNYNYLVIKGPFGIITKKIYTNQSSDFIYSLDSINIKYSNIKNNLLSLSLKKKNYLVYKQSYHIIMYLIKKYISIVSTGFLSILQIWGIGYKILKKEGFIYLYLGYSHLIQYKIASKTELKPFKGTFLFVTSHLKNNLLLTTSKLKKLRRKDAYKGKGIRFLHESIKLKIGKKD